MKKILILLIALAISGCSTALVSNKKFVQDNTLFSTYRPKSKINVSSEYEYIGNSVNKKHNSEYGSDLEYNRYIFAKYDKDRRINSGIEILISTIKNGSAIWLSDSFKGTKNLILNNVINIFGKHYKQAVLIDSPGNISFYNDKGFISPGKGIAWGIARNIDHDNKVKFEVYYWEDLEKFNDDIYGNKNWQYSGWLETGSYDERKQNAIDEFVKRAKESVVVSDLTQEEYDNIVNGINISQPDNSAEKKLLALKKLYDDGLISLDEYEQKRKEIIANF